MTKAPKFRLASTPTGNRVAPELGSALERELNEALEAQRWVYNEYKARKSLVRKAKMRLEYARIYMAKNPKAEDAYTKLNRANEDILTHQLILHKLRPHLCRARANVSLVKIKVRANQRGYDEIFGN